MGPRVHPPAAAIAVSEAMHAHLVADGSPESAGTESEKDTVRTLVEPFDALGMTRATLRKSGHSSK